tara:strand:- start:621 stop:1451 length:831 start_codon:yes stop_codon:yes gene_type:complete
MSDVVNELARAGYATALRGVLKGGCKASGIAVRLAVRSGSLECVRLLVEHGVRRDRFAVSWAARVGNFEILDFLLTGGFPYDELSIADAAGGGHVNCIVRLITTGCKPNAQAVEAAARAGQVGALKFLVSIDCPWSPIACELGSMSSCVDTLRFCCETTGRVGDTTVIYALATGCLPCVQYLHEDVHIPLEALSLNDCEDEECLRYAYDRGARYTMSLAAARQRIVRCVFLPKWREAVRARAVVVYWLGKAAETSCAEDGDARKRDRHAFEHDFIY